MYERTTNKKGFTLTEVLITLTVVGVLASITIPGLMQSTSDQELKTAFKKEFSIFDQATRKMAFDNGGTLKGLFYNPCSTSYDTDAMRVYYQQYLNVSDKCTLKTGCGWYNINNIESSDAGSCSINYCSYVQNIVMANKKVAGSSLVGSCNSTLENAIFLSDGSIITIGAGWGFDNLGVVGRTCNGVANGYNNICESALIDVNGFKKPNRIGRDIFHVWILSDRAVPTTSDTNNFACETGPTWIQGIGCSSKVLLNQDYKLP